MIYSGKFLESTKTRERKIRILIAKVGLDGHDRGAQFLIQALREAGFLVYYTGIRKTPEQVALAAITHKVDVIGLSSLSGAHRTLFPKVVQQVRRKSKKNIPIIAGGIIPVEDIPFLLEQGIVQIFNSTHTIDEMITCIVDITKSN